MKDSNTLQVVNVNSISKSEQAKRWLTRKGSEYSYTKEYLNNPVFVAAFVASAFSSMIIGSIPFFCVTAALLATSAYVFPKTKSYKRGLDNYYADYEVKCAFDEKNRITERITEDDRYRFYRLEAKVRQLQYQEDLSSCLSNQIDLDELLAQYLDLAQEKVDRARIFRSTCPSHLKAYIDKLNSYLSNRRLTENQISATKQRVDVLEKRLQAHKEDEEKFDIISQQMNTISDFIFLLREQSVNSSPRDSFNMQEVIDSLSENGVALKELNEYND